jgi:hypothetical protein
MIGSGHLFPTKPLFCRLSLCFKRFLPVTRSSSRLMAHLFFRPAHALHILNISNITKEVSMVLRVQYHNDKFDYVNDFALGKLITTNEIKRFYRPSEERWITIGQDTTRGAGGHYAGPDRRQHN